MKKHFYTLFTAVSLLLAATSCSQEEDFSKSSNGMTSFSISLNDKVGSRTVGDGASANKLYYQVFMEDASVAYGSVDDFESGNKLDLSLLKGETYSIVFWAQNSGCNIYDVEYDKNDVEKDGLKTIGVNYDAVKANEESYDAFYCVLSDFLADGKTHKVTLTRPFAQLNLGTSDWNDLINDGTAPITQTSVKVTGLANMFYPLTGEASVVGDVEVVEGLFDYNDVLTTTNENGDVKNVTFDIDGVTYTNLSLNYLLVPTLLNDEKATVDLEFNFKRGDKELEEGKLEVSYVPLRRNYRTNIIGTLLTGTNFDIIIDANPEGTEKFEVTKVSNQNEIQEAINNAKEDTPTYLEVTNNITFGEAPESKALSRAAETSYISIPAGKNVVLDLKGFTINGFDSSTGNFALIENKGTLTITNSVEQAGKLAFTANSDRDWNAYSSVVSNQPGGNLTIGSGVVIEHQGGTDMAYGIDNLTNGKGTVAVTTIDGATIKSSYRAIRQFLNGVEATNELYVKSGVIEGTNKSIWMQDPSKNANTGKLVVSADAQLKGDVYLFVTEGSTEWPVEVSIDKTVLNEENLMTGNLPDGYAVIEYEGAWIVVNSVNIANLASLKYFRDQVNAGETFENKTVMLAADIDLNNEEWIPIGSVTNDHGFMGNFDGNGKTIKNLHITNITPDSDGYVYAGLFGVTEGTDANENYIKNLTIENVNISTEGHIVAAAIAYPYYTNIENITVKGNINIKGGNYTSGVLAYTRRCVNAKDLTIAGNEGSTIEGKQTVGGVISDIQMNGGLKANYSNFSASGLTVKGDLSVGGISGIISSQALDGATVKNVTLVCEDARTGIVSGALGGKSDITNVSYENVTGATRVIGATYDGGYYFGQILEVGTAKAIIYTIEDGVKAVSVAETTLKGKTWQDAMNWAAGLGDGWALASMEELNAIYDARVALNDVLKADNAENALFWEGDELKIENGSIYYASYMSSTEVPGEGTDANGNEYFANRVFFKLFNDKGYSDVLYSAFDCINKSAPLRDNHFARGVITIK